MYVVLINHQNGYIKKSWVFNSQSEDDTFEKFISKDFDIGNIVVAACNDDYVTKLS